MKVFIILLKTFLILTVHSHLVIASTKFLQIKSPSKLANLKNFQINALNKMSLEIVLKSGKYQILLNSPRINKNSTQKYFQLQFKVVKQEDLATDQTYNLEYRIKDLNKNKAKKSVRLKNILGRRFLYHSRFLLYRLFFGNSYIKRNKNQIEREARKDLREQNVHFPVKEKLKPPNLPKATPNKAAQSYQEESDELQRKIKTQLSKIKKKRKNSPQVANSLNDVPSKDLQKNNLPQDKSNFKLESSYQYSLGYSSFSTFSSNSILSVPIEVQTNYTTLEFSLQSQINLPQYKKSLLVNQITLSKVLSSDSFELTPPMKLEVGFSQNIPELFTFLKGSIIYSTHPFVSIASAGSGLTPANSKIVWTNISSGIFKRFKSQSIKLNLSYQESFIGMSDFLEDATITGNIFKVGINYQFLDKLSISPRYSIFNISSPKFRNFSVTERVISLFFIYN